MARQVPAAEVKRLARLRELAREERKAERALERAILAAAARGISVRRIARATGQDHATVWRLVRSRNGQAADASSSPGSSSRIAKPKTAEKKGGPS